MNLPGVSKQKKHDIRNKAAALESRMKAKLQSKNLNQSLDGRKLKYEKLADIITSSVFSEGIENAVGVSESIINSIGGSEDNLPQSSLNKDPAAVK